MSVKFYTLLTDIGAAKLASATALGIPLKITKMAVGDGGGVLPTPNARQTALVAEKRRADLNMLYIDPQNSSQIIAEQVIPETEGGWWIREVGLFDETDALIAVGNCPESYKPQLVEGSGRTQTVRMVLITSSTDNITLKIDPSVVLATRSYVDNAIETRQKKSDTLTALAELKPAKGKLPYFTAEKVAALADLSDFFRPMLNKEDAEAVLEYLGLGDSAFGYKNMIVFSAPGVTNWAVPAELQNGRKCYVEIVGGGGAGGRAAGGGGGGGGGIAKSLLDLSGIESVQLTIGAGGIPPAAGTNNIGGGVGGSTSFGSYLSATGGAGGATPSGGGGGTGIGGDFNSSLGAGDPGSSFSTSFVGGTGGGPGGQGAIDSSTHDGIDAYGPGGGGGGAALGAPAVAGKGGKGGNGIIIIRW